MIDFQGLEKQYGNFILQIEWMHMEAGGNSGGDTGTLTLSTNVANNVNVNAVVIGSMAGAVGLLDDDWGPQRAVYRVEAGCGRHGRRERFDLAHDPDSGRWQLERVTDR